MATGKALAMLPWFPRDYIAATRHMSLAERGAYTDLLFAQWENGPLPRELERLARIVGCPMEEFEGVWNAVKVKFIDTPHGIINERLEEHRTKAVSLSQKRALIGKLGGEASGKQRAKQRLSKHEPNASAIGEAIGQANDEAKSNSPSPSPSPSPESGVSFGNSRAHARRSVTTFHHQVIDAYHRALPELPRVKAWTEKRRRALEARIAERTRDGKPADTIEYWAKFFDAVAQSDFLCGRSSDFHCDLEWLLRPENFLKVIEGRYANQKRTNGGVVIHGRH
jgi:uncharacterized protein YdaU (DUF1376 family)